MKNLETPLRSAAISRAANGSDKTVTSNRKCPESSMTDAVTA